MERRNFIFTAALGASALAFKSRPFDNKITTAQDLQNWLRELHPVKEPSVDRIVIGDPDTKIQKAGTCWTPYFKTLRVAYDNGINVMIVHEPTFYTHWDLDKKDSDFYNAPSPAREQYIAAVETKRKWIEENGMVIIRCHDVMDILGNFGIPFALGSALGFSNQDIIRQKDYFNVYKIQPEKAANVATYIAGKLKEIHQPGVAFYGDPDRMVASIGLGTGCICDPQQYAELKPDLTIAIDDTIRTWIHTTYAEDTGNPLVVINHGTSEETGMRYLNEYMKQQIPDVEFQHFVQGCGYKWITSD